MDTFLGSLVQSCCEEGGTPQTNNTGVCSHFLGCTGFAPAHGMCAFPVYTAEALGCSAGNCLRLGPGLYALPRSKPLRFRYSGSPQRCRLGWACILCPSQVQVAQVFGERGHCNLSPLPSLLLSFLGVQLTHLLRRMMTVQSPKKS